MTDPVFKAPKTKKGVKPEPIDLLQNISPVPKRKRTPEDFYYFCCSILEHEKYAGNFSPTQDVCNKEEVATMTVNSIDCSVDSLSNESSSSSTSSQDEQKPNYIDSADKYKFSSTVKELGRSIVLEDEDRDSITCFCGKPYAGRAMIECSKCLTWIHLTCAKVRKNNIPKDFICQNCRTTTASTSRRSQRVMDSSSFM